MTPTMDLAQLRHALREFTKARDWDRFHSPKNLATALVVEAAELVEHFQWLSEQQSERLPPEKRTEVAHEMADVLFYLVRIADRLDIDLMAAARDKLKIIEKRYPPDKVRGSAKKYTEY